MMDRIAHAMLAVGLLTLPVQPATAQTLVNEDEVLEELKTESLSGEEIRQLSVVPEIEVVSLEGISDEFHVKIMRVLKNTEDNFAEVRTAMAANPGINRQISQAEVDIDDVIAATRGESGSLTVYTDIPALAFQTPEGDDAEIEQ